MKRGAVALLLMLWAGPAAAGELQATWTAPTTNTDGSALTDLDGYRVYASSNQAQLTPCQNATLVYEVPAASPTPSPGTTATTVMYNLTEGARYWVAVTALNAAGTEGGCSALADAVARPSAANRFADDFNRPDTASGLGPAWASTYGPVAVIVGGAAQPQTPTNGTEMLVVGAAPPAPDQRAQAQIVAFGGPAYGDVEVLLRAQQPGRRYYQCGAEQNPARTHISRRDETTGTTLAEDAATAWAPGDWLTCDVSGQTLVLRKNGAPVLSVTDATYANGAVGLRMRDDGAAPGAVRLDNFSGGTLADVPLPGANAPAAPGNPTLN